MSVKSVTLLTWTKLLFFFLFRRQKVVQKQEPFTFSPKGSGLVGENTAKEKTRFKRWYV